jgi:outer membrane protein assembly factor BamB
VSRKIRGNVVPGLALIALAVSAAPGCQWTESTEAPAARGESGCTKDTDCKGDRICEAGICVAPRPPEPPVATAPAPASSAVGWARGGPGHPGPTAAKGPTEEPKEIWDRDLGAVVFASPALGTVSGEPAALVGTHGGRFVGVALGGARAGEIVLDVTLGGMVWATAAVAGSRAYVGADDDTLYAIDLDKQAIAWTLKLGNCDGARVPGPEGARCDADGGPTIAPNGDLIVGADGVYRISPEGQIRWHYPRDPNVHAKHVFAAPLVAGDGTIYVGGQDGLFMSLSADGELRWTYSIRADVDGGPALGEGGTLYVGADDGRVHALRTDGSLRWSFVAQKDIRSAIAIGEGGAVYATSFDGNLYALSPGGDVKWVLPTGGKIHATPVVDAAGNIFFGSQDERLYAVTPRGKVLWAIDLGADIDSSVAIASDGTLVVGCDDGHLRAFR